MTIGRSVFGYAVALAVGLAACTSGDEANGKRGCTGDACADGGSGGDGGTGGGGGTGGAGGDGGATPTCDPACAPGEACVERSAGPACACTGAPDSCGEDAFCNPDLRCEALGPIGDFFPCDTPERLQELPDGSRFFCTAYLGNDFRWLRVCGGPDDCLAPNLICMGELVGYHVAPYCVVNRCGVSSLGYELNPRRPGNGEPFGACSATSGYLGPDTVADGTCFPHTFMDGSVGGTCVKTGTIPKGRSCKPDAHKAELDELCEPDSACLAFRADEPARPCAADADCVDIPLTKGAKTGLVDGYCGKDATCMAYGSCDDLCNSGLAGSDVHPNAGCADPVGACTDLSGSADSGEGWPVLAGFCEGACRVSDEAACPDWPAGNPRACYPSFDEEFPLDGKCIDRVAVPKAVGETCDKDAAASECPSGAACLSLSSSAPARCTAWCVCEEGFDPSTRRCRDPAPDEACAPAGTACTIVVPGSRIGVCAS